MKERMLILHSGRSEKAGKTAVHGFIKRYQGYCSLVISREVFFVSEGHIKPETYRANLCD